MLGKYFRTGIDRSGSEWEMVDIARISTRDEQLPSRDELTEALNARSECEVFKRSGN